MGRQQRGDSEPQGAPGLQLELVQTRVSTKAHALIRKRAEAAGLKKSAWVRVTLYRALGLSKG
jgi:hypothetical protein